MRRSGKLPRDRAYMRTIPAETKKARMFEIRARGKQLLLAEWRNGSFFSNRLQAREAFRGAN